MLTHQSSITIPIILYFPDKTRLFPPPSYILFSTPTSLCPIPDNVLCLTLYSESLALHFIIPPQSALVQYDLPRARGTSSHLPVSVLVISNLPACTQLQALQGQGLFWQSVLLLGSSTWRFLSEDLLNCIREQTFKYLEDSLSAPPVSQALQLQFLRLISKAFVFLFAHVCILS